jgi:hypothetical protein
MLLLLLALGGQVIVHELEDDNNRTGNQERHIGGSWASFLKPLAEQSHPHFLLLASGQGVTAIISRDYDVESLWF